MKNRLNSPEKELYIIGLTAPVILFVFALLYSYIIHILPILSECMFNKYLGIYCPGCGGTRAIISLFKGHFIRSFIYHPFVIYAVSMYLLFMILNTIKIFGSKNFRGMKFRNMYLYIGIGIITINFIAKNVLLLFGYRMI